MSESLHAALNQQIKHEFDSAYLYLSASLWFTSANLPGMAHWMRTQSEEETGHGMKFVEFLEDRGAAVTLEAIDKPVAAFDSPVAVFEAALAHEQKVTGLINDLYELAVKQEDYPTQVFMHWFITEQVEEEKSAAEIVERLRMAGDDRAALLMIDSALGERQPE